MPSDRWTALQRLDKSDDFHGLVELLDDQKVKRLTRLRRTILIVISRSPEPFVTSALIDAYKLDPSGDVRLFAAYLLAERAGPDVEPVLIEALKDDNVKIRIHAARGLARTGSTRAIAALTAALAADSRAGVREDVVSALGRIGGPDVVEPLTRALEDKSLRVRLRATRNLSRVGAKGALPAMRRARDRAWPPWRFLMSNDIRALERSS